MLRLEGRETRISRPFFFSTEVIFLLLAPTIESTQQIHGSGRLAKRPVRSSSAFVLNGTERAFECAVVRLEFIRAIANRYLVKRT